MDGLTDRIARMESLSRVTNSNEFSQNGKWCDLACRHSKITTDDDESCKGVAMRERAIFIHLYLPCSTPLIPSLIAIY
jgi:hypothetical protein